MVRMTLYLRTPLDEAGERRLQRKLRAAFPGGAINVLPEHTSYRTLVLEVAPGIDQERLYRVLERAGHPVVDAQVGQSAPVSTDQTQKTTTESGALHWLRLPSVMEEDLIRTPVQGIMTCIISWIGTAVIIGMCCLLRDFWIMLLPAVIGLVVGPLGLVRTEFTAVGWTRYSLMLVTGGEWKDYETVYLVRENVKTDTSDHREVIYGERREVGPGNVLYEILIFEFPDGTLDSNVSDVTKEVFKEFAARHGITVIDETSNKPVSKLGASK